MSGPPSDAAVDPAGLDARLHTYMLAHRGRVRLSTAAEALLVSPAALDGALRRMLAERPARIRVFADGDLECAFDPSPRYTPARVAARRALAWMRRRGADLGRLALAGLDRAWPLLAAGAVVYFGYLCGLGAWYDPEAEELAQLSGTGGRVFFSVLVAIFAIGGLVVVTLASGLGVALLGFALTAIVAAALAVTYVLTLPLWFLGPLDLRRALRDARARRQAPKVPKAQAPGGKKRRKPRGSGPWTGLWRWLSVDRPTLADVWAYARSARGVVTPAEVAMVTGWGPAAVHDALRVLLVRLDGHVEIDPHGALLYVFPRAAVGAPGPAPQLAWQRAAQAEAPLGAALDGIPGVTAALLPAALFFVWFEPVAAWLGWSVLLHPSMPNEMTRAVGLGLFGYLGALYASVPLAVPLRRLRNRRALAAGLRAELLRAAWEERMVTSGRLARLEAELGWPASAAGRRRWVQRAWSEVARQLGADREPAEPDVWRFPDLRASRAAADARRGAVVAEPRVEAVVFEG